MAKFSCCANVVLSLSLALKFNNSGQICVAPDYVLCSKVCQHLVKQATMTDSTGGGEEDCAHHEECPD